MFFVGTVPTVLAVIVMFFLLMRKDGAALGVIAGIALIFIPYFGKVLVFGFFCGLTLWALADRLFGAAKPWFNLLEPTTPYLENKYWMFLAKAADYTGAVSLIGFYLSMGLVLTNLFFTETNSVKMTIDNRDVFPLYAWIWSITSLATVLFIGFAFVRDIMSMVIDIKNKPDLHV
jgi:hypothetical protein